MKIEKQLLLHRCSSRCSTCSSRSSTFLCQLSLALLSSCSLLCASWERAEALSSSCSSFSSSRSFLHSCLQNKKHRYRIYVSVWLKLVICCPWFIRPATTTTKKNIIRPIEFFSEKWEQQHGFTVPNYTSKCMWSDDEEQVGMKGVLRFWWKELPAALRGDAVQVEQINIVVIQTGFKL